MELTPAQVDELLTLARLTIVRQLSGEDVAPIDVEAIDPGLLQPAGCFVSLHARETHALRGCVGRIESAQPLIHVVRDTALATLNDPRFHRHPVTLMEVPELEMEISVLSPLRPAEHPMDFDLLNHGIVLSIGGRNGVFLPQVARDTGWSREQLLARLCAEKLGMPPTAWQLPQARLHVFSTMILGPTPLAD
jgi:AmmeMemoRadiSam system protein A